ncbi:hypothetical protein GCM10027277_29480 [Pseudoduganella ginsengisoli]
MLGRIASRVRILRRGVAAFYMRLHCAQAWGRLPRPMTALPVSDDLQVYFGNVGYDFDDNSGVRPVLEAPDR